MSSGILSPLAPSSYHKNKVSIKVRIQHHHAVAAWSWNANDDDVCGICQAPFEGVCPGVKYPGEDCPVVWGKCGHAYHLQCVSKWLSQPTSKNSCPICRQDWEYGSNSNSSSGPTTTTNNVSPTTTAPTAAATETTISDPMNVETGLSTPPST